MRVSLSYEKLFVKNKERRKEFETLADVRACILDSSKLSCITKRVVLGASTNCWVTRARARVTG